jgi:hypothetical protein
MSTSSFQGGRGGESKGGKTDEDVDMEFENWLDAEDEEVNVAANDGLSDHRRGHTSLMLNDRMLQHHKWLKRGLDDKSKDEKDGEVKGKDKKAKNVDGGDKNGQG